jgi:general secretion pathway protein F
MAIYEYKALDPNGKNVRGVVEADSEKTARSKLKKSGYFITQLSEKNAAQKNKSLQTSFSIFNRIKITEIALVTRQLASLVKANIPLVDALTALIDQTENEKFKVILSTVRQDVNEGSSLAKALAKHPKVFSSVYVNMIEAGETSGTLPLVLLRLADFQESQVRLKNTITSAMMYPALMMIVAFLLLIGIFVFVIPKMVGIFASMNKPMPLQTQILLAISNFIVSYWWLLLILSIFSIMLFLKYIKTKNGKRRYDAFLITAPIIGPLMRMVAVSRFASTMATLLNGGVPIITAMNIVKNVVSNTLFVEAIDNAKENITEGQSIALPLKKSGQFPPLVIHMIAIGEKTGELPQMLENVSKTYEEQLATKIEGLTSLIEPLMIVFMGAIVGGIVAAIFVPLLQLNDISG